MSIEMKFPHVFQPIQIGPLKFRNRMMFTPMVSCLSTPNGEVTNEYVEFIEMQAKTGVALVTIGSTSVNEDNGIDVPGELDITTDKNIGGLLRLSEAAHRYGAKLSVELCHAGRGAYPGLLKTPYVIAPSAIPTPVSIKNIKVMDQDDIDQVIKDYVDCSVRLKKAGFDMVMIHAGHGNLIGQFLSPYSNKRTDIYGGSLENRSRFAIEILEAVRTAVGPDFGLDMRISGDEIIDGGMKLEEVLEFLKVAQKYLNTVQMTQGIIIEPTTAYHVVPPWYYEHCHNVKYAEAAKKVLDIPVSTFGSVTTIAEAEEILASGKADCVGMARPFLADSNLLKNAYRGEDDKTRPCLRCLECLTRCGIGQHVHCAVNPVTGRETRYKNISLAPEKKKVMVIGSGPAGMMATQILRKRGHEVILCEKQDKLGGRLNEISVLPFKGDMRRYLAWDVKETMACGADIRLNTEVTPELIETEKPDALFVATGSAPIKPNIPGIDLDMVKPVIDVDCERVEVGKKVVVCGGGTSGLECGLSLAMKGHDVTVVDMMPVERFGHDMAPIAFMNLADLLKKHNVKLIGSCKVDRFVEGGVEVLDNNWNRILLPADTAVAAFGMRSENTSSFSGLVYDTYFIGDCDHVKNIYQANHSAFDYAMEV